MTCNEEFIEAVKFSVSDPDTDSIMWTILMLVDTNPSYKGHILGISTTRQAG